MQLEPLDVAVFVAFLVSVISIAIYKSREGSSSEDYFLASRGLTWPLIGLSIVAANISTEQMVGMAGQGAGDVGLAVCIWQLAGSVGIVVIAFTILPRFLQSGIYTMPEFLEYRYNSASRAIMALTTVVIYVVVLLTAVIYSGALTLRTIFDVDLRLGVWMIGIIAGLYTTWGGLKAVAWADLIQGMALLIGGAIIFGFGLHACGGWDSFASANADRLHVFLPASDPTLPWTGVFSGMWIVILYYCGLNQFIVQRNLAAKTLHHGQMGLVFAGGLWLLVPFVIVMPGMMAKMLYPQELTQSDAAFPTLIRHLVPTGVRGFIFAAISGAVISSLSSMLNSASTIFTLDIYRRLIRQDASQKSLVLLGRAMTMLFVVIGCLTAPILDDPKYGGVFQFIQKFQGYIWPGVVAAFVIALTVPRAPGAAGPVALIGGPILYGVFQYYSSLHFLIQVALTFIILCIAMLAMTWIAPLEEPRRLPIREEMTIQNSKSALLSGMLVIAGVATFVMMFW